MYVAILVGTDAQNSNFYFRIPIWKLTQPCNGCIQVTQPCMVVVRLYIMWQVSIPLVNLVLT